VFPVADPEGPELDPLSDELAEPDPEESPFSDELAEFDPEESSGPEVSPEPGPEEFPGPEVSPDPDPEVFSDLEASSGSENTALTDNPMITRASTVVNATVRSCVNFIIPKSSIRSISLSSYKN